MPQEFRVLLCAKCSTYQVDIVKKIKKFQCKMCNEKQSVQQEFFRGQSSKICRQNVQRLNEQKRDKDVKAQNFFCINEAEDLSPSPNNDESSEDEIVKFIASKRKSEDNFLSEKRLCLDHNDEGETSRNDSVYNQTIIKSKEDLNKEKKDIIVSKWAKYVEKSSSEDENDDPNFSIF